MSSMKYADKNQSKHEISIQEMFRWLPSYLWRLHQYFPLSQQLQYSYPVQVASSQVRIIPGELRLHMHNLKYINFSNIIFDWDSPYSIMSSLLSVQMLYDKAIASIYDFIHVAEVPRLRHICISLKPTQHD